MKEKQFYVYTHARPDGSVFYVGKGLKIRITNFYDRSKHHKNIVAKYGKENIIVESKLCVSEQHAFDLEVKMIAALRNGGVKLVNITDGGEGASGNTHTDEAKEKIRAAAIGRTHADEARAKIAAANVGKVLSVETRAKMSAFQKGKTVSPETRAKMVLAWEKRKIEKSNIILTV